jgi:hypothetical protein
MYEDEFTVAMGVLAIGLAASTFIFVTAVLSL